MDSVKSLRHVDTVSHKWIDYIKALLSKLRNLFKRGNRKIIRAKGERWLQGNSIFQTKQSWCIYKHSDTVEVLTRFEKIKPDKIIPWRWRSGHSIPPLNKKLSESILAERGGNNFSPVEWHGYINHSRAGLVVGSSLQNKTNSIFFTLFSFVVVHKFYHVFHFILFCYFWKAYKESTKLDG